MPGTRRHVLKGVGSLVVVTAWPALAPLSSMAQRMHHSGIRFGVQLNAFPIDPQNFQSLLDTLAVAKKVGYEGFECSYLNVQAHFGDPQPARRKIGQSGLAFFGVHIFMDTPMYDRATCVAPASVYEPVALGGAALAAKYLILSGAPAADAEQLQQKIAGLNAAGAYCKQAGLGLAYHNHALEFTSTIHEIETLYMQCDPKLVSFLLDAGHAYEGGADVPAFLRRHWQRIVGIHLRDIMDGRLVSLGQGTFPLAAVAFTLKDVRWKGWMETEEEREDHSKRGLEVIAPAYQAMKEAFCT